MAAFNPGIGDLVLAKNPDRRNTFMVAEVLGVPAGEEQIYRVRFQKTGRECIREKQMLKKRAGADPVNGKSDELPQTRSPLKRRTSIAQNSRPSFARPTEASFARPIEASFARPTEASAARVVRTRSSLYRTRISVTGSQKLLMKSVGSPVNASSQRSPLVDCSVKSGNATTKKPLEEKTKPSGKQKIFAVKPGSLSPAETHMMKNISTSADLLISPRFFRGSIKTIRFHPSMRTHPDRHITAGQENCTIMNTFVVTDTELLSLRYNPRMVLVLSFYRNPNFFPAEESHPQTWDLLLNDNIIHTVRTPSHNVLAPVPLIIPTSSANALRNIFVISATMFSPSPQMVSQLKSVEDYSVHLYIAEKVPRDGIVTSIKSPKNFVSMENCLSRVHRLLSAHNEELSETSRLVKLLCPVSQKRPVVPVRSKNCRHLECFDADAFLAINEGKDAKYLCPICKEIALPENLIVDQFFQELLSFTTKDHVEISCQNMQVTVMEKVEKNEKARPASRETIILGDYAELNGSVICID